MPEAMRTEKLHTYYFSDCMIPRTICYNYSTYLNKYCVDSVRCLFSIAGSEAPSRVLGLCSAVVWTTPHRSYRRITGYDVSFVNPGSDNVIVAKGNRELFHVIGDEVSVSNQERVMVQVGYI